MASQSYRSKPLVTFGVAGYNHERYVREAIAGVLGQTYEPLDIILSDDCSSDRTFEIMQEMAESYRGPHQIRLNRNKRNIGIAAHFTKLMDMARGEIFTGSASDDISTPDRVAKIVDAFQKYGERVTCVWTNALQVDGGGSAVRPYFPVEWRGNKDEGPGPIMNVACAPWVLGATVAYDMKVWRLFGGLDPGLPHEDVAMAIRCRLIGDILYLPEMLVHYRIHGSNLSHLLSSRSSDGASWFSFLRQILKDCKVAHRNGYLSNREYWYYCLSTAQRLAIAEIERRAGCLNVHHHKRPKIAVVVIEQLKRVPRLLDGRLIRKILLPRTHHDQNIKVGNDVQS